MTKPTIPDDVSEAFIQSKQYFPSAIQAFQFFDKYSRFNYEKGRRETWVETVERAVEYLKELSENKLAKEEYTRIRTFILEMKATPSMRLLAMAGPAARRSNIAIYNCSYLPMDSVDSFVEELIIAMAGCGVGFSVEKQYIDKLPEVKPQTYEDSQYIFWTIEDSTEGWAEAFRAGLTTWFSGHDISFDYSKIRSAGTPLKVKGGRACLTGDTLLYKDRKKLREENTITIQQLLAIKNEAKAGRFERIKLRCLDEKTGVFYRNTIVDIVDNGIADVYELLTKNGYKIRATNNHRFMNIFREYQEVKDFDIGDRIAVNGKELKSRKCFDCDTQISRRATRCVSCKNEKQKKDDPLSTTARQRKECREYAREYGKKCELCEIEDIRMEVHHIDHNPLNNDWSNLINLCSPCHQKIHAIENNYGDPYKQKYVSFDEIVSITPCGQEQVYDLQMAAPNHNFVANGFVSHNSGPAPFEKLLTFTRKIILQRQGKKLRPIDAHDIACMVGEAIVSGGVRRTALISLFDGDDQEMLNCKNGDTIVGNEQRWMANNSAVWTENVTQDKILSQMYEMYVGQRGEPGIFSRYNANRIKPSRRKEASYGTNPCGEINLRPYEFCNLTIAIARADDTLETLKEKIEVAALIGTIQSMGTNFPGLRDIWKQNCQEERLLGVDINGQMDCPLLRPNNPNAPTVFKSLRKHAVETNKKYAELLGINQAAAVTCVKPSGNSALLFNCSSGLHPRHSQYYIRNARVQAQSPLKKLMALQGVPMNPENGQTVENATAYVIHFPVKAPEGAITRNDLSALEQCEHWLRNKLHWTEHNPSVTISYRPEEVIDLIKWVADHKEIIGGMSFLPISDAKYAQMPNEEITKEQYEEAIKIFPEIDFSQLWELEKEDFTTASTELACVSGACSIEDYQAMRIVQQETNHLVN